MKTQSPPSSGIKFLPKSCQIRFWLSGKTVHSKTRVFPLEVVVIFSLSTMKSTHFPLTSGIHFPSNPPKVLSSYQCFVPLISSNRLFGFLFFGPTKRSERSNKKHLHQLQLPLGRWRPPGGLWVGAAHRYHETPGQRLTTPGGSGVEPRPGGWFTTPGAARVGWTPGPVGPET